MPSTPAQALRDLHRHLEEMEELDLAPLARVRERLERDLLPRTAGEAPCLVVGIVGPNNAGKSTLFNALIGAEVSPAVASGGATRRLLGGAHPDLLERLRADPAMARFKLQPVSAAEAAAAALEDGEAPELLLVVPAMSLPPGLLLIDTPDFDSIHRRNRLASESLLTVADLAVAVVTRHSYQNREVVEFLHHWLAHGRPWLLVYNEAPSLEVVRQHAARLAADVGAPPEAVFHAPHSLPIQDGSAALQPLLMDGEPGDDMRAWLLRPRELSRLKARALRASLAQLSTDLDAAASALEERSANATELLAAAELLARRTGTELAHEVLPTRPLLEAFRVVLDRRSHALRRRVRSGLQRARQATAALPGRLGLRRRRLAPPPEPGAELAAAERAELDRLWPPFWEELARQLGPEACLPARREAPAGIATLLDRDLGAGRAAVALEGTGAALEAGARSLADYQAACEELVEEAFSRRGRDWDLQLLSDAVLLLPAAGAAALVVTTGGLGADSATLLGGLAGEFLAEKYLPRLAGSPILAAARDLWARQRGEDLARILVDAALPGAAPRLRDAAADSREQAAVLRCAARHLASTEEP